MNRIKELRIKKRMTQIALSIELGVSQELISAYETGKTDPNLKVLIQLSKIFNVSIDYIVGLSDTKYQINNNELSYDEINLLLVFRKLTNNHKERLGAYLQGLSDN